MKHDLGAQLKYPDYRSGLQMLAQSRSSD
jgi:hypothetical protein